MKCRLVQREVFFLFGLTALVGSAPSYHPNEIEDDGLVPLVPQESCYYEPFHKRLACVCKSMDVDASLDLKVAYFYNSASEIKEVSTRQCSHLSVRLDLRGVDSTYVPIHFNAIERLEIKAIEFEPTYLHRQELELHFNNVQELILDGLNIENTLKLKAVNVKEARFRNMTFAHIPTNGIEISRTRLLDIRDSTFIRIASRSIVVEKTKEVYVAYNKMNVNAFEAVYATDGSLLHISCNTVLGRPLSPECSRTTTMTTTTTTTTTTVPVLNYREMDYDVPMGSKGVREEDNPKKADGVSGEMIGGIVAGIAIVIAAVLFFVAFRRKHVQQQDEKTVELQITEPETKAKTPTKDESTDAGVTSDEKEALLATPEDEKLEDSEDVEQRHKFASPIWIDEIQKNKIFNRQKSLLSEESIKDMTEPVESSDNIKDSEDPSSPLPAVVEEDPQVAPEAEEAEDDLQNEAELEDETLDSSAQSKPFAQTFL